MRVFVTPTFQCKYRKSVLNQIQGENEGQLQKFPLQQSVFIYSDNPLTLKDQDPQIFESFCKTLKGSEGRVRPS